MPDLRGALRHAGGVPVSPAMEKERREAIARTLETLRLATDDGLTRLKYPVLCQPDLKGWRLIPKTEYR